MAIPFYFCPYRDLKTGHIWCDGMLGGNFPWKYIPEKEKRDAIGMYFPQRLVPAKPEIFDYLNSIISFRNNFEQKLICNEWADNIISIPTSDFPSIALDLSKEDREHLYQVGLKEVVTWWVSVGRKKFIAFEMSESLGKPVSSVLPRTRSKSLPHPSLQQLDIQQSLPYPYTDSGRSQDLLPASQLSSRRWSV
jgi:hypothetical protein